MNLIARQSIKNSIVNYFGLGLGVISTLFIYPLNWEIYGKIQFWIAAATILTPILRFGSTALINKFFPYFKKENISGFFGLILIITIFSILLSTSFLWIISTLIPLFYKKFLLTKYINELEIIYPLAILIIFSTIFHFQSANMKRIVVPDIIDLFKLKVVIPIIILLSTTTVLTNNEVGLMLLSAYFIAVITQFIYLQNLGRLDINWNFKLPKISQTLKKQMLNFWIFGGLNYLGTIITYKIDTYMIGSLLNYKLVAFYSSFLFLASVLDIPFKAINKISGPIISNAFKESNFNSILNIYKKSTSNLLLSGVFIFLIIWINIDSILNIMTNGEDLTPYKLTFLIIGLAKIFDLATGVNNLILIYSKHYKYNLIFLLFMGILNVFLNFYFIEEYGLIGVAIATAFSLILFNIIKTLFIYIKLQIQPFQLKSLIPVILLGVIYYVSPMVNIDGNDIILILVKSTILSLIFLIVAYKFKLSEELNRFIERIRKHW